MKFLKSMLAVALLLGLAACGDPSKQDILEKAKGADTSEKLEKALGKPADMSKLGPIEKWTYKAKDGQVTFVITAGKVMLDVAGGSADKK
jgi:hypothetical protein